MTISKFSRLRLKCDGTREETRFRLLAKKTSPLQSAGASVQSTTGSRGVRISGSNAGYTMFRGSVKGTDYPPHSRYPFTSPTRTSPSAITFPLDPTTNLRKTYKNSCLLTLPSQPFIPNLPNTTQHMRLLLGTFRVVKFVYCFPCNK